MRPDRLVVGEVRGAEVVDLLAAMNTGHEGGCGTLHANSAADVPARVEALALAAGLAAAAVHSQLASAVDAVVHLARGRDGRRRVAEVGGADARAADGRVVAAPAVTFAADGATREHRRRGPPRRAAAQVRALAVAPGRAGRSRCWCRVRPRSARARDGHCPAGRGCGPGPGLLVALAGPSRPCRPWWTASRLALGLVVVLARCGGRRCPGAARPGRAGGRAPTGRGRRRLRGARR